MNDINNHYKFRSFQVVRQDPFSNSIINNILIEIKTRFQINIMVHLVRLIMSIISIETLTKIHHNTHNMTSKILLNTLLGTINIQIIQIPNNCNTVKWPLTYKDLIIRTKYTMKVLLIARDTYRIPIINLISTNRHLVLNYCLNQ